MNERDFSTSLTRLTAAASTLRADLPPAAAPPDLAAPVPQSARAIWLAFRRRPGLLLCLHLLRVPVLPLFEPLPLLA